MEFIELSDSMSSTEGAQNAYIVDNIVGYSELNSSIENSKSTCGTTLTLYDTPDSCAHLRATVTFSVPNCALLTCKCNPKHENKGLHYVLPLILLLGRNLNGNGRHKQIRKSERYVCTKISPCVSSTVWPSAATKCSYEQRLLCMFLVRYRLSSKVRT